MSLPCCMHAILRSSPGKYPTRAHIQKSLVRGLLRKMEIWTWSCSILYPRFQFNLHSVFECCTELRLRLSRNFSVRTRVNEIKVMYERPSVKRESWARFNFYVYAWPFFYGVQYSMERKSTKRRLNPPPYRTQSTDRQKRRLHIFKIFAFIGL